MEPVLAFVFGGKDIVIGALTLLSGLGVGSWLFRKDSGVEERRDIAVDAVEKLRELGLDDMADLAKTYAVGNYSALLVKVKEFMKRVTKGDKLLEEVKRAFFKILPKLLEDSGDRDKILKVIKQYQEKKPA